MSEIYRTVMTTDAIPAVSPYARATQEFVFERVWARPGLSVRDRRLVTLSCVCAADATSAIDAHFFAALASGDLTLEELLEFVLHFAVYCGWPKGSVAQMSLAGAWVRMHEERGEEPPPWPELPASELGPDDAGTRLRGGEQHFLAVNFVPAPARDTPYFQAGILNFVFGHVWQRPRLSQRDRRLVTLPCVGASDAIGPIWSHVGSALQSGDISYEEMQEIILHFSAYCGFAKGEVMEDVATQSWARLQGESGA